MRPPTPITLFGLDGSTEPTEEQMRELFQAEFAKRHPHGIADPEARKEASSQVLRDLTYCHCVLRYHNRMAQLVHTYRNAAAAVRVAVDAVYHAYAELRQRTTTGWHAAHHRYIVALADAQDAYATLNETLAPITALTGTRPGIVSAFYDTYIPADQRITAPDTTRIAGEHTRFTDTNRRRLELLAHTLTGTIPAGFEPDPTPGFTTVGDDRINLHRSGR